MTNYLNFEDYFAALRESMASLIAATAALDL